MAGEEIRQDTRTVEQIVDGMSLFDDDLMSMVFDGNIEATELLLKIIAKDMYYPELAKGVKHFKEEGGREKMCEAVEKYGDRRAESARLNNLLENVRNLMESMKWSAEQAMSAMKVSDADKAVLLKEL